MNDQYLNSISSSCDGSQRPFRTQGTWEGLTVFLDDLLPFTDRRLVRSNGTSMVIYPTLQRNKTLLLSTSILQPQLLRSDDGRQGCAATFKVRRDRIEHLVHPQVDVSGYAVRRMDVIECAIGKMVLEPT